MGSVCWARRSDKNARWVALLVPCDNVCCFSLPARASFLQDHPRDEKEQFRGKQRPVSQLAQRVASLLEKKPGVSLLAHATSAGGMLADALAVPLSQHARVTAKSVYEHANRHMDARDQHITAPAFSAWRSGQGELPHVATSAIEAALGCAGACPFAVPAQPAAAAAAVPVADYGPAAAADPLLGPAAAGAAVAVPAEAGQHVAAERQNAPLEETRSAAAPGVAGQGLDIAPLLVPAVAVAADAASAVPAAGSAVPAAAAAASVGAGAAHEGRGRGSRRARKTTARMASFMSLSQRQDIADDDDEADGPPGPQLEVRKGQHLAIRAERSLDSDSQRFFVCRAVGPSRLDAKGYGQVDVQWLEPDSKREFGRYSPRPDTTPDAIWVDSVLQVLRGDFDGTIAASDAASIRATLELVLAPPAAGGTKRKRAAGQNGDAGDHGAAPQAKRARKEAGAGSGAGAGSASTSGSSRDTGGSGSGSIRGRAR